MKRPVFKKIVKYTFAAGVSAVFMFSSFGAPIHKKVIMPVMKADFHARDMVYENLGLESMGLSREAFDYAMRGMEILQAAGKIANPNLISIIDFSLPSNKKRLFVIDLQAGKLLFNTLVSHGRNSGQALATEFSNDPSSFKSSLGFYITGDTYKGEHGTSLRLEGEEEGINDNALARGIVMHSANYVNEQIADAQGYIGRSLGCPALPVELYKQVIDMIKNGTCLFLYSPDKYYMAHSKMIQQQEEIPVVPQMPLAPQATDTTVV
jgi:hypothetical protein